MLSELEYWSPEQACGTGLITHVMKPRGCALLMAENLDGSHRDWPE